MEDNDDDDDDDDNNNNTEETSRASMTTTTTTTGFFERDKKGFCVFESSFVRWSLFFLILSTFFFKEKGLKKSFFPFVVFRVWKIKKRRRKGKGD